MNRSRLVLFPVRALVLGFALTFSTFGAHAQIITQIIDATGDGSGNTLHGPQGIAVDAAGNVYVIGDSDNAFKITPAGVITQIIDATGDGSGNTLSDPGGIGVDAAGNVYVTGYNSNNAFKITQAGAVTQIIDHTGDGTHNLEYPVGIAVDAAGTVFVTGAGSDNAFKITSSDTTQIIDATGDGLGHTLSVPYAIAVDAAGNVFVTGSGSHNAFKITSTGAITQIIDATGDGSGSHPLYYPEGIAVDAAGNVYVTGYVSTNAFKITQAGAITQIIDYTGDGSNPLGHPFAVAVDPAGNVYLTGESSGNAFKITQAGAITQIIDDTGDGLGHALGYPDGVAVDAAGNVYVAGYDSKNAFKIEFDDDGDGIANADDLCPGTVIPEATVPSKQLGKNRFALVDSDFEFDTVMPKGHGPNRSYNTVETGGCSCEQILSEMGLDSNAGLVKFGCDVSTMDAWVASVGGVSKRGALASDATGNDLPETFRLEGNYPNPFNPSTSIRFDVPEQAHVLLVVYDVTGREVARLLDKTLDAGTHEVRWDASSVPSGTYLYRLTAGSFSETKAMTLLR